MNTRYKGYSFDCKEFIVSSKMLKYIVRHCCCSPEHVRV